MFAKSTLEEKRWALTKLEILKINIDLSNFLILEIKDKVNIIECEIKFNKKINKYIDIEYCPILKISDELINLIKDTLSDFDVKFNKYNTSFYISFLH